MIASVVVATILVAGALVLPYNYAMAGGNGSNHQPSKHIQLTKIDIKKSVQAIKEKVKSKARGGNANGGTGGTSTGGSWRYINLAATVEHPLAAMAAVLTGAQIVLTAARAVLNQWCCYKRWRNANGGTTGAGGAGGAVGDTNANGGTTGGGTSGNTGAGGVAALVAL